MYKDVPDKRNTSNGMTPAKSISRPSNPPVKPIIGNYNKPQSMKPTMRPMKRGG